MVKSLKEIARSLPVLPSVSRAARSWYLGHRFRSRSPEEVFTSIHEANTWGGRDSVSGQGSDEVQTGTVARELPALIRQFDVTSVLDIPCGDFHWMRGVDLGDVDYIGADIVRRLVLENQEQYGRQGRRFERLDLLEDPLPRVDLIFSRDCLVHLSFADISRALGNVCRSRSKYFLSTTFPARQANADIVTGQWRVLNLERPPLDFPAPLALIDEQCTEDGGAFRDKALGLWKIADLKETLAKRDSS